MLTPRIFSKRVVINKRTSWQEKYGLGLFNFVQNWQEIGSKKSIVKSYLELKEKTKRDLFFPTLIKPKFLKQIKKYNPYYSYHDKDPFKDCYIKNPTLKDITNINNSIFIFDKNNNILFNDQLDPIPLTIDYDYIGTCLTNRELTNLSAARKILKEHPNVLWCSEIIDIPYYNRDEYRTKYLEITVLPDQEEYQRVYKKEQKGQKIVSYHNLIFDYFCSPKYLGLTALIRKK